VLHSKLTLDVQKFQANHAVWGHPWLLKCTKTVGGRGFAPDPTGGAYSAPPDPLAEFGEAAAAEREQPLKKLASSPQNLNPPLR